MLRADCLSGTRMGFRVLFCISGLKNINWCISCVDVDSPGERHGRGHQDGVPGQAVWSEGDFFNS